jgi:hypothetical protein
VRSAEWRARPGNAERNREIASRWYAEPENAERAKAATKRSYKAQDPAERRAKQAAWREANRGAYNALIAAYKAQKRLAVPTWANRFFISEAYDLAAVRTRVTGFEWQVDHVVPLQSDLVCGLHVEHNLAVVPKVVNLAKGNRFWPDMPD